jgi:hypothetical protein
VAQIFAFGKCVPFEDDEESGQWYWKSYSISSGQMTVTTNFFDEATCTSNPVSTEDEEFPTKCTPTNFQAVSWRARHYESLPQFPSGGFFQQ